MRTAWAAVLGGVVLSVGVLLGSCRTPDYGRVPPEQARRMIEERRAAIAAEAPGDYFVGRRYYMNRIRGWGYLRRPGQSWDTAKLVIFREDRKRQPDRFPERVVGTERYGFDHNHEYIIRGRYTGKTVYDPNFNAFLPEFLLLDYSVRNTDPGFLFQPGEFYDPAYPPRL